MTDDAQPQEGQGGSPFDSYLQTVPDAAREAAETWFKDTSKGLNSKLEEGAESKRELEAYRQIENLPPPDQLAEVMGFLSNPEAIKQWAIEQAEAEGYTKAEAQELGEEAELREEGFSEKQIQEMVAQTAQPLLQEQLQPLEERLGEMEFARGSDIEAQSIREELARLEAEHKLDLDEEQRGAVLELAMPFAFDSKGQELPAGDISWVVKGFDRFKDIGTQANRTWIEQASAQPAAAITAGGMAKTKPITNFEDANAAARERWRAQFRDQSQT